MKNIIFFIIIYIMASVLSCNNTASHNEIIVEGKPAEAETLIEENDKSEDIAEIGWKIMEDEKFGELALNLDSAEVTRLHGIPDKKTKEEFWGADGAYHSDWIYEKKGLSLGMSRDEEHPEPKYNSKHVFAITVFAPSELTTLRGIGINSSIGQVRKAYREAIENTEFNNDYLVAGTVYGGLVFRFKDGKVAELFLGAMAE